MRVAGRAPNRGVVFATPPPARRTPAAGCSTIADRRTAGDRYLLLEDGDVWHAVDYPAGRMGGLDQPGASPELDAAVDRWLAEPNDDLVTLLARSRSDARMGGSGWLADGEPSVEIVTDAAAGPDTSGRSGRS